MTQTKTLFISFTDEGGNKKNIAVSNPKERISGEDAKSVADIITNNNLIFGKQGFLKTYNGAFIVTRTQKVL